MLEEKETSLTEKIQEVELKTSSEISELNEKLENLVEQKDEVENRYQEVLLQKIELEELNQMNSEKIEKIEVEKQELEIENKTQSENLSSLQSQLDEKTTENEVLQSKHDELLASSSSEIDELRKQIQGRDETLQVYKNKNYFIHHHNICHNHH